MLLAYMDGEECSMVLSDALPDKSSYVVSNFVG